VTAPPTRALLFSLFLSLATSSLFSWQLPSSLVYREGNTIHRFHILGEGGGYRILLESEGSGSKVSQIYKTDALLRTLRWELDSPGEGTRILCERVGDSLRLKGLYKGEKVEKEMAIDSRSWNQLFHLGLLPFVLSRERETVFWSVGVNGPGAMKAGKVKATKRSREKILSLGQSVETLRVEMSLTGLLSLFWKGDYWYSLSEGLFLRYGKRSGKEGSGAMELIEGR